MSHITKEEYLSAFVDGEAGSFEQHRICDQLLTDEAMRDKLTSFALIGEAIRNRAQDEASVAGASFLSGIQDAIANEKPLSVVAEETVVGESTIFPKKKRFIPKQAAGYAIAASVAAVAAISFQNYINTPNQSDQFATASAVQPVENTLRTSSMLPSVQTASIKPAKKANSDNSYFMAASYKAPDVKTRDMIDKYVAHHLQYASTSTLMPRVRAVSYKTDF
jgi:negative regulator of sigma E activity